MKRPQTKFHTDTMSDSKVIKSKKVKIYCEVKILVQHNFFLFIDILVKQQQQILIRFCKISYNSAILVDLLRLLT